VSTLLTKFSNQARPSRRSQLADQNPSRHAALREAAAKAQHRRIPFIAQLFQLHANAFLRLAKAQLHFLTHPKTPFSDQIRPLVDLFTTKAHQMGTLV
jgi:hypothetical protein